MKNEINRRTFLEMSGAGVVTQFVKASPHVSCRCTERRHRSEAESARWCERYWLRRSSIRSWQRLSGRTGRCRDKLVVGILEEAMLMVLVPRF